MSKKALILIDVQYDFLPGGALAVPDGDKILGPILKMLPKFDLVVATQDFHPADHGSFASNHEGKNIGEVIELNGLSQILWPNHCVQGTRGAELVKEIERTRITRIFQKGTDPTIDSYSGFFDNAHRKDTGLGKYLKDQGVTEVYLVGLATDYCVKFTALDAVELGFKTVVVKDACRGVNLKPGDAEAALQEMKAAGAKVVESSELGIGR